MGLSLKLLGEFAVCDDSGAALSLPTRKTRALLAYLAANADKPQQRGRLIGLLWSNFGEKQARHNLSQALLSIRKLGDGQVPALLDGDGEQLTLRSAAIDIDLVRFHALLGEDSAAAAKLYHGPFLDGLTVPDPSFDEWLTAMGFELHSLACDALERAADAAKNSGDSKSAIATTQRLVALDPLRESAHRRLMTLLHQDGNRAAALRHYQSCAEILRNELNIEPDSEMKALYDSIKQSANVGAAAATVKTSTLQPSKLGQSSSGEKPSIAILPFANMSGDPNQDYLVDGIQLAIYATLIKVSGLFLIGGSSVSNYREKEDAAERAGPELGVRYILEGAVQTAASRVRVTLQLTDTMRRNVIWAEQYDRVLDDLFVLQDEIALEVLAELDIKLISGEEMRIFRNTLTNPEAREFYYRGLSHFYAANKADNAAARQNFRKVASMQPDSPEGPAFLCLTYWRDVFSGWTENVRESLAHALEWAEIADRFVHNNGMAYIVQASDHLLKRRFDDALETCFKAYDYRPSCPAANGYLANILHYCGESREAVVRAKEALRILPNAPPWFTNVLAAAYREDGDIESSIAAATESLKRNQDDIEARTILCSDHVLAGSLGDAERFAEEILTIDPDFSVASYARNQPFRDAATLERIVESLCKAGLPD